MPPDDGASANPSTCPCSP